MRLRSHHLRSSGSRVGRRRRRRAADVAAPPRGGGGGLRVDLRLPAVHQHWARESLPDPAVRIPHVPRRNVSLRRQ